MAKNFTKLILNIDTDNTYNRLKAFDFKLQIINKNNRCRNFLKLDINIFQNSFDTMKTFYVYDSYFNFFLIPYFSTMLVGQD